jgi:ATP-binding cassette subfamily C protein LapB
MTIIVSTHRLSLLSLVERLLLFDKGRLVADGPRDQIIAKLQGAGRGPQPAPTAVKPAPKADAAL